MARKIPCFPSILFVSFLLLFFFSGLNSTSVCVEGKSLSSLKKNIGRKTSSTSSRKTTTTTTTTKTTQRRSDDDNSPLKKVYLWYLNCCAERPLLTKGTTCGIICGLGDIIAQSLETTAGDLNIRRVATFFICNALFTGPFVHYWYQLLGTLGKYIQTKYNVVKYKSIITQVTIDQTLGVLLFFPLYLYIYDIVDTIIRKQQFPSSLLHQAYIKTKQNIRHVILMQYRIFPIANTINFALVPEQLRVLFSNTVSLFWNIYLCSTLT